MSHYLELIITVFAYIAHSECVNLNKTPVATSLEQAIRVFHSAGIEICRLLLTV